jgi:uncharacterized membrane protein
MESRVKILGHPVHPMLIPFPLGLLGMAAIFDIIGLITKSANLFIASCYMICAGIITGLLAAVFGLIDFLGIPKGTRAWRVGRIHGIGNVIVVGLFIVSWYLRYDNMENPGLTAIIFAVAGFALAGVTGWLGGELVDRLGVGVDDGANLDAPSSLSGLRASEKVGVTTPAR